MAERTRVTIIAGFLGVGKTSVLKHLLNSSNPSTGTAVLVNEIGAVGIDGDLIAGSSSGLNVHELVGGCICCTGLVEFRKKLVEILRSRPEHLFVEPTGVAGVGTLLNVFAEPGIASAVRLDPTLVVVDPRHWDQEHIRTHELYQEQCTHADVMIVSHEDCCDAELLSRFREAHATIPLISAHHGTLDTPWCASSYAKHAQGLEHLEQSAPTVAGFRSEAISWPADQIIELPALRHILSSVPPPDTVLRCKGIVRSDAGWCEIQLADCRLSESAANESQRSRIIVVAYDDTTAREWWQTIKPSLEALPQKRL